jgi:hypothetical protein
VAFASLTHNRLTTFARLPDHSNTLLRVLLLESSSFTRVTPRTQLHLDCAVFNTPTRHATSVGASNRAGPIKTSRSGKPKVQFGPVLSDLKLCRNYSESTAQGAGWIALSRPPQCVPCARLQISRKPTRAGTVPSGLRCEKSLCFLCGWVGGDKNLVVSLACSLLIFRSTVFGRMVGFGVWLSLHLRTTD